ncbi:MAG TPA: putative sulfate exporter family transporter [Candidatus Acidoferrum sp.]|nr:putative sulfate exporter family transporter [Candidatus Acidoferrum sp.]
MPLISKIFFLLALVLSFTGLLSAPVALSLGIIFGLTFTHPYAAASRTSARILLQVCVVALGFGMNLHEVLKAGRSGFIYTAVGISFALLTGLILGKMLRVHGNSSYLITAGTAICGGSAIAAIGPILSADDEEMAVSLGTVFILNSVALLLFPPIGGALHLSQSQFGLWAALAIHDTSSVVGAAAKYGQQALVIGTTVKLARALWIVPLALATAAILKSKSNSRKESEVRNASEVRGESDVRSEWKIRSKSNIQFPWFILFFCLAAVLNTYAPAITRFSHSIFALGRVGLVATLFLIGTGISRSTLKEVGWRPLLQGVLLWLAVGVTSLYFIRIGWIGL